MYIPPAFAAPGDAAVLALLREVVLAQTVWSDATGALQATPLPWLEREGEPPLRLQAHLPRRAFAHQHQSRVHGEAQLHDDPDWVLAQIEALTDQQEGRQPRPWRVADAAAGHVAQLLRVLVGVELRVQRIEAKFKLGQNRSAEDRAGLAEGLAAAGDPASAALLALMRESGC